MEQKRKHRVAPVMGFERLRENVDGPGIRTLVLLGGCPLHCEYCLNKLLLRSGIQKEFTPDELYDILMVDSSYFKVTGGGITFGGGEPALHSRFIRDFYELCKEIDDELDIRLETSLNVPLEHIQLLAPFVSKFYVDVKDMNPEIYCDYTHEYNYFVYTNLEWLSKNGYDVTILEKNAQIGGCLQTFRRLGIEYDERVRGGNHDYNAAGRVRPTDANFNMDIPSSEAIYNPNI